MSENVELYSENNGMNGTGTSCDGPLPARCSPAGTRFSSYDCWSEVEQGSEQGSDGMFLQKEAI